MIGPIFDMFTAAIFFSGKFLNVGKHRTTISPLTAWPGILWKWASVLTKLPEDGESRLALFHATKNLLANEMYNFSRMFHQTSFVLKNGLFTYMAT